jgi:hypothetical protein
MKTIITISLFSILLFYGCDRSSELTSPISDSYNSNITTQLSDDQSDNRIDTAPKEDPVIDSTSYPPNADDIFIPLCVPLSETPNLVKTKVINGFFGGEIEINHSFETSDGDTITIWARLNFPQRSFNGVEEISMIINNEIGTISFYPHMVFNIPAGFNLKYTGLDLSGIDPHLVDFIFQNYDGKTEQINYDEIIVDVDMGVLRLVKGRLNHFSRYGWIRDQQ